MDLTNYSVFYSDEDHEWVATCVAYPSLSWLDNDPVSALAGLCDLLTSGGVDL